MDKYAIDYAAEADLSTRNVGAVSNRTIWRRAFLGAVAALPAGVLAQPQTPRPASESKWRQARADSARH
jgi:hypothetical protein